MNLYKLVLYLEKSDKILAYNREGISLLNTMPDSHKEFLINELKNDEVNSAFELDKLTGNIVKRYETKEAAYSECRNGNFVFYSLGA